MNKLSSFLINQFSAGKADCNNIRSILSKAIIPGIMALSAYSSASMADYTVWYDGDIGGPTYQEHQLYNGNTLLIPPAWACGRKFSTPSYYRHLDAYYNTFGSADFWKDIYVWIPKPGCPHASESVIEYTDGSQTFSPPIGAAAIEITTNYSSQWVDGEGRWPYCANCSAASDFTVKEREWEMIFEAVMVLKKSIFKKDITKFNDTVLHTKKLLTSFEENMNDDIKESNVTRSENDKYRLANVEGAALNQLSMARQQLNQCILLAGSSRTLSDAYPSCDLILENLQRSKSLWRSRN